jgi:phosphatidyl-myo-inositol dimannoside synthase
MKVLIPSYDFKPLLGGVAHYVHEIALHLHQEHHAEVTILARQLPESEAFDANVPYQVQRIFSPKTALLSQAFFARQLITELPKNDLVICPLWFPDATATFIAQSFLKTKLPVHIVAHGSEIFSFENSFKTKVRRYLLVSLKKKVFNTCRSVLAVSHFTHNAVLSETGIAADKVHTINNGVNVDIYKKNALSKSSTGQHLVTVSRLVPYKGIDTVLNSLPTVIEQFPSLQYTIVGDGPDLVRLKKIVSDLNLEKNVVFLEKQSQQKIIEIYNRSDLFIMMSRQEFPDVEGFGLVFLEAAACGTPSIGGNSGGIPDAIEHEKTGWLLPPADHDLLAKKLISLFKDKTQLIQAGEAASLKAQTRTWKTTTEKIWNIIHAD